jgi:ribonuclease VapC
VRPFQRTRPRRRSRALCAPILISAATLAEALIVASRLNVGAEMASLIDGLGIDVMPVTPASARRIAAAYDLWGKGLTRQA